MPELDQGAGESSAPATPLTDLFDQKPSESASKDASTDKDDGDEKEEASQKFPEGESSSKDEKSDTSDKPKEKDDKPADKKAAKPEGEQEKKEETPSDEKKADKWDVDDNPFKKRFQDTSANWNKEHQEKLQLQSAVAQLQQETTILRKIADGTYDPEKDDPRTQVTPEVIANKALQAGKALASHNAAVSQFGKETVEADLNEFHSLFGANPMVQHLVLSHESPVYEARRIMERFRFEKQYGSSPADWKKNIRAEVEKEMKDTMRKELTDEIMGRVDKKKSHPAFSSSRGSNGLGSNANSKSKGPTPLKDVFGR